MRAKLIGVPASHPTRAVELMLERKHIPYERVDIPNQLQKVVLPLLRYPYQALEHQFVRDPDRPAEALRH